MARENIDLNSPDATKVRGSATATTRSGKVDSFISAAKSYFGSGDTADPTAMQNMDTVRTPGQSRVYEKFAGKQLHQEHTDVNTVAKKAPTKTAPVNNKLSPRAPVNKKKTNGVGVATPVIGNIYDQFKAAHGNVIKTDMQDDGGNNPT